MVLPEVRNPNVPVIHRHVPMWVVRDRLNYNNVAGPRWLPGWNLGKACVRQVRTVVLGALCVLHVYAASRDCLPH